MEEKKINATDLKFYGFLFDSRSLKKNFETK